MGGAKILKPRTSTSIGAAMLGIQPLKGRKTHNMSSIKEDMKKLAINQNQQNDLKNELLSLVKGRFKPNCLFTNVLKKQDEQIFESIIMYQIQGSKFEQIIDPNEVGIFDASRSYFIIFTQPKDKDVNESSALAKQQHAVYLWIGADQSTLTVTKAISKLQETEFRSITLQTD